MDERFSKLFVMVKFRKKERTDCRIKPSIFSERFSISVLPRREPLQITFRGQFSTSFPKISSLSSLSSQFQLDASLISMQKVEGHGRPF